VADDGWKTPISGLFYRYVYDNARTDPITAAHSPEGRFHHSGQAALYMSPTQDWAAKALKVYIRPDDPLRSFVSLRVEGARIVDLRNPLLCASLGLDVLAARANWRLDRKENRVGSSWVVSDTVRDLGADGLIYPSRTEPHRWNLVLFRWNEFGGPKVAYT